MSTEANKALVRRMHESFDKGDWVGMQACFAAGFKAYATGQSDALDVAGFEPLVRAFMGAFSQPRHVFEEQVAEGDRVATRATWSAVHSGSFNGVPPSSRPVRMEIFMLDRIAGGRIVEHRAGLDLMGLMVQIGAMPAPG